MTHRPYLQVSVVCALALTTAGCQTAYVDPPAQPVATAVLLPAEQLQNMHDVMVAEMLPHDLSLRGLLGKPVPVLPPDSVESWQGVAQRAKGFRSQLEAIDTNTLNSEDRLTQAYLITLAESLEAYPGNWLYSFPVTPYSGGWRHNGIRQAATSTPLTSEAERAHYLRAMQGYGAHIRSQSEKLRYQASKGIRVAKPAISGARRVVANLGESVAAFVPARERLGAITDSEAEAYRASIEAIVDGEIKPAFAALGSMLDQDYFDAAPERVGLMHQPGGIEQYRKLAQLHTGTTQTPEEIHAIGMEILRDARAELEQIKAAVGFEGTNREFAAMVDADPRFAASTPKEVEAHFERAMKRIEPVLPRYFSLLPKAPYAVERAPAAVEQGMTFGYYRSPTPELPIGAYLYNGSQPESTSYANAAALIYHELLPGHHFQIALQLENENLPLLRRANSFLPLTAYVEGWAEYAADLADEMGMYRTPYEKFGRLYSKMFLANRLVVDTGLNGLGWTLTEARAFMKENTFASDAEIESELLRYSTDIPGQALAYAMGQRELLRMRAEAQAKLGDRFSFPEFHAQVLSPGALPIDLLDTRLKRWQNQVLSSSASNE